MVLLNILKGKNNYGPEIAAMSTTRKRRASSKPRTSNKASTTTTTTSNPHSSPITSSTTNSNTNSDTNSDTNNSDDDDTFLDDKDASKDDEEYLTFIFQQLDEENTGYVDSDQVRDAAFELGYAVLTSIEFYTLVTKIGIENDGEINLEVSFIADYSRYYFHILTNLCYMLPCF